MAALEVELKMLGSDGIAPKDTFVSMRVGDSQKQSRLQASRTFKFAPGVADLRGPFGRIEVFKRVGSATVGLSDPTEVQVDCGEGDLKWLRFQVQASGVSSTTANKDSVSANKPQSQAAKERVDEARKYLEEHRLEELIASAMREIIRLRPSEPHKFLCDQIMGLSAAQRKGKENSVPPPPPVPKAEAVDVADLRQQAKAVLLGAAESGALKTALSQKQSVANAKVPDTEELRQQAKAVIFNAAQSGALANALQQGKAQAEPMQKEPLSPAGLRPSVGTWLSPRPKRVAHAAESATPAPAATEPPVFALRPSVGSWLAPRPRPFLAAQVSKDTTEQVEVSSSADFAAALARPPGLPEVPPPHRRPPLSPEAFAEALGNPPAVSSPAATKAAPAAVPAVSKSSAQAPRPFKPPPTERPTQQVTFPWPHVATLPPQEKAAAVSSSSMPPARRVWQPPQRPPPPPPAGQRMPPPPPPAVQSRVIPPPPPKKPTEAQQTAAATSSAADRQGEKTVAGRRVYSPPQPLTGIFSVAEPTSEEFFDPDSLPAELPESIKALLQEFPTTPRELSDRLAAEEADGNREFPAPAAATVPAAEASGEAFVGSWQSTRFGLLTLRRSSASATTAAAAGDVSFDVECHHAKESATLQRDEEADSWTLRIASDGTTFQLRRRETDLLVWESTSGEKDIWDARLLTAMREAAAWMDASHAGLPHHFQLGQARLRRYSSTVSKKIALCVSSKNRLWQLKRALPLTLLHTWPHRQWVHIYIVDFGSVDGSLEFLRETCRPAIEAGILSVFTADNRLPDWHASVAKNTAHMVASADSDIVVNLDCDNLVSPTFLEDVSRKFHQEGYTALQFEDADGTCGRIACSRQDFIQLRGYDEDCLPMGGQDTDLILRLKMLPHAYFKKVRGEQAIPNSIDMKVEQVAQNLRYMKWSKMNSVNCFAFELRRKAGQVARNVHLEHIGVRARRVKPQEL
eukprot:TRINITY_DN19264_c0_g4_i3.p1 TRINITY_DN19264_c0_g4~~TRINITY_DN19264_c0_g4_i3.p1  ORF type:complete len:972 (+),score=214.55 TRINITY_DN19264_c0_g4_i3:74-2989(+)